MLTIVDSTPPLAALGFTHSIINDAGEALFFGTKNAAQQTLPIITPVEPPEGGEALEQKTLAELRKAYEQAVEDVAKTCWNHVLTSGLKGVPARDRLAANIKSEVAGNKWTVENKLAQLLVYLSPSSDHMYAVLAKGESWLIASEAAMERDVQNYLVGTMAVYLYDPIPATVENSVTYTVVDSEGDSHVLTASEYNTLCDVFDYAPTGCTCSGCVGSRASAVDKYLASLKDADNTDDEDPEDEPEPDYNDSDEEEDE